MGAIYDKTGREIMQGDILKVFHFVGRRNKHHYMYKQVVGERRLGKNQNAYWFVSHLDQREDSGYLLAKDGTIYDAGCWAIPAPIAPAAPRPARTASALSAPRRPTACWAGILLPTATASWTWIA